MRETRFFALFLSLVLALSTVPALAAESDWLVQQRKSYDKPFPDVTGTWCASYVETVYEAGLMEGKTADRFDAVSTLTNAQIMAVSARLLDLLKGGDGQIPLIADAAWYLTYYNDMAPILGYETGSALTDVYPPNDPCTRIAFVNLLSAVLKGADTKLPVLNRVTSIPDLDPVEADEAYDNVLAFYNAGILNGADDYGSFRAFATLKRGEAAAMLARLVDPAQRLTFTPASFSFCTDLMGVAEDTVVAVMDGTDITMKDFAPFLAQRFFTAAHLQDSTVAGAQVPDAVTYALSDFKRAAAVANLAQANEVTLSAEEEADLAQEAKDRAGLGGLSEEMWRAYGRTQALSDALTAYYYKTYGYSSPMFHSDAADGETRLREDLLKAEEALSLSLTGVLKDLNWTAIGQAAADTPYAMNFYLSAV